MHIKEPQQQAKSCIIWLHGLGADAQDMIGLSEQLQVDLPIRHVFLDAPVRPVTLNNHMPMRAWFDIVGIQLTDREDRDGIFQSESLILDVIQKQKDDGFEASNIYLAGFSQGGAMALYSALRHPDALGGVIALSSYLPLANELSFELPTHTPIFAAAGLYDPLVLPAWSKQSFDLLRSKGYTKIDLHEYPMEHAICHQEVLDLSAWLAKQINL